MKKNFYLLLIICFLPFGGFAQRPPVLDTSNLERSRNLPLIFDKYIRNFPKEKIHVHFDKSSYKIGDTVWYKVYLVNSFNNQLSSLSKIVHLEIANSDGYLQKNILSVIAGMSRGQFVLSPEKFKSGIYKFNFWTPLMNDQKKSYPYIFNIGNSIYEDSTSTVGKSALASELVELEFFPESGSLVSGLRSKVVVKSRDAKGKPFSIKGYIENENKEKIAEFNTGQSGMGLFAITPEKNRKYEAIIKDKTPIRSFPLPNVSDSGYVVAVNLLVKDTLSIRISKSGVTQKQGQLVFQSKGSIFNSILVPLSSTSGVLKIPIASFHSGINEIALFSNENKLLANRFFFLSKKRAENVMSISQQEYGMRENARVKLKVLDDHGVGIAGGFSMSVSRVDINDKPNQRTIFSDLILYSGSTHGNNFPSINQELDKMDEVEVDMYLLTQRFREYSWDEVLIQKPIAGVIPEQGLSIRGKVIESKGTPIAGAKMRMFSAKDMILIDTIADDRGNFLFQNFTVIDSADVEIKVTNISNEEDVTILIDAQNSIATPLQIDTPVLSISSIEKEKQLKLDKLNSSNSKEKINQLKTVEIAAKRRPMISGSIFPFAAAPPDYTIEAEELHKIISLTDYLRSRFIGVVIKDNKVMGTGGGPMLLLLNGLNIEDLSSINPRSLAGVQIVKGGMTASNMADQFPQPHGANKRDPNMYGQNVANGVVILTSSHSSKKLTSSSQQATGIIRSRILGFSEARNFYSPNYQAKIELEHPDRRNPLFWKPDIISGEDGLAEISFYTSDEIGTYRVTLEGIGINGQVFHEETYFNVK
jgi:hypothetical protein